MLLIVCCAKRCMPPKTEKSIRKYNQQRVPGEQVWSISQFSNPYLICMESWEVSHTYWEAQLQTVPKAPFGVRRMFFQQIMFPSIQKHLVLGSKPSPCSMGQKEFLPGRWGVPTTPFPGT